MKKRWKIHTHRGPEFRTHLALVNADLARGGRLRDCYIDHRGPTFPQRIITHIPGGRQWRLTLRDGINLFREAARGDEFVPLHPDDISKWEWYQDEQWEREHAPHERVITAVLTGRLDEIAIDHFIEAFGLQTEQFEQMQREEPDLFKGPMINCRSLLAWFETLPALWKARQGGAR
jgi:hypothetical protein